MKYDSIFDVIGHIMVGPSSSHTAGACRIGFIIWRIFGKPICNVNIYLHGSFAETYVGHGTDKAIVAGLLGIAPDNENLKNSFQIAKEQGMNYTFHKKNLGPSYHPNTILVEIMDGNETFSVIGSSIGGGNIVIEEIEGLSAGFNGDEPTLIFINENKKGVIAKLTQILAESDLNIADMHIARNIPKKIALGWIEVSSNIKEELIEKIEEIKEITMVRALNV